MAGTRTHETRLTTWRDLEHQRPWRIAHELLLSAPWLVAEGLAVSGGHYLVALVCAFMFFLTALRQVHGAFHYTLGLSRRKTDWAIAGLSVLMLGSNHAVRHNHLRHHAHCLGKDDVEGAHARLPWWQALLFGPAFPVRAHIHAFRRGTRNERRWITAESCITVAVLAAAACISLPVLRFHVLAMVAGQCLAGFFCVWSVHHGCGGHTARTERKRWLNRLTYNMLLHVEHHLYPTIPTANLHLLADRLDAEVGREGWILVT